MADKKWIQKADIKKGAFTKKANKAKEGVQEFAHTVEANPSKYSAKTRKQAALAETFAKMNKKK